MSVTSPFEYYDPLRVDAVAGLPDSGTVPVLVITIDDPSSSTVTFTCNGTTHTGVTSSPGANEFLLTAVGTDKVGVSQVCWTGKVEVTGISGFKKYEWTVAQGSNSNDGSFFGEPTTSNDYRILWASCDVCAISPSYDGGRGQSGYEADHPEFVHGIWPYYKELVDDKIPATVNFYVDDYGYIDRLIVDDTNGNTGQKHQDGVQPSTLRAAGKYHDYALAYLCALGFCGTADRTNDTGMMLWGRQKDRAYVRRNTSFAFQWGDHEFKDNMGWEDATTDDPTENPYHATYVGGVGQSDGAAKTIFESFFGHIRPPLNGVVSAADTDSKHWSIKYGSTTLCALDRVTKGSGGMGTYGATPATGTVLGTDQIDDIRESVDTLASPFTLLGVSMGLRYHVDEASYPAGLLENNCGDQQAIYDHSKAEYQRLFTSTTGTPASLMNNAVTNGNSGNLVVLHADYHRAHSYRYEKAAYTGNAAENYWYLSAGTANGMANVGLSSGLLDRSAAGISALYDPDWGYGEFNYRGLYLTVYGSKPTKRLDAQIIDENGRTVWGGKMFTAWSNYMYSIGQTMGNVISVSTIGKSR